ncbi:MAG: hypothetical protein II649_05110, partial [Kiritimatiellae bacterium]|nr:hypothetical protein [Kiritimatiellia bacterium]
MAVKNSAKKKAAGPAKAAKGAAGGKAKTGKTARRAKVRDDDFEMSSASAYPEDDMKFGGARRGEDDAPYQRDADDEASVFASDADSDLDEDVRDLDLE